VGPCTNSRAQSALLNNWRFRYQEFFHWCKLALGFIEIYLDGIRYPDVVLLIEVGYKYRFFGGDAETAARVLGIFAHYDHNFLTASIPTFRLHVHVRRLVESGYKVGVVRQTETAAIKAHGSNKAGPFTRGLSALYTRATLEAAEDLGGENEGHVGRLNNYLMCIAEEPVLHGRESNKGKEVGSLRSVDDDDSRYYDMRFGVVAVEIATGDVMYGDFKDTVMRSELEARLLTCTPAELLLAMPISSTTEKLVMEFAGPTAEIRVEHMTCDAFRDGGAMAEVLSFYGIKAKRNTICTSITSEEELLPEDEKINPGLEAVMAMPDIVARALAFTLRYLKQFNLEKVLLSGASFRLFTGQTEMRLSPNTLRQLEVLF
jgi:DNA mismatch repair protein MSH3